MKTLTVKDLQDKLKEYPEDMEVLLCFHQPYEITYADLCEIQIDKTVTNDNTPYLILCGYDE